METRPRLARAPQDSRWAARLRRILLEPTTIVAVLAPPSTGLEFAISEMDSRERPLVWVDFNDLDDGDARSQGIKLTAALERAMGAPSLEFGRTIAQVLARTARDHALLGPFVFCFSGVRSRPPFLAELQRLRDVGSPVILHWRSSADWSDAVAEARFTGVHERDLRPSHSELAELLGADAPGSRQPHDRLDAGLLDLLRRRLPEEALERIVVPVPGGAALLRGSDHAAPDASTLARALASRGRARDAFELLVHYREAIPDELAASACRSYLESGLQHRLWRLFEALPQPARQASDVLMRWYFSAATAVNQHHQLRDEVRGYLEAHEAPELRALFAAAFPGPEFEREAIRAHQALETPTTLRIRAFASSLLGDGTDTVDLLRRALRLSERLDDHAMVVASATDLADHALRSGAYHDAIAWADWAVDWYRRSGCRDELRRLVATSVGTYGRLLAGEPAGGHAWDPAFASDAAGIPTSEAVLTTAAEFAFVSGDLAQAEQLFRTALARSQISQYSRTAIDLVHVLLHLGRASEAAALGAQALSVSNGVEGPAHALGLLAYALPLVETDPCEARRHLAAAVRELALVREAPRLGQAAIMLARSHLADGDLDGARAALALGAGGLRALGGTGWRLLGGFSDEVQALRGLIASRADHLEFAFLGQGQVRSDGNVLRLGLRQREVLLALALHPRGLSAERLGLMLYGEAANVSTIKAIVSRLRHVVPIASKPYRIAAPFWADFVELERHVGAGRHWDALSLYRGRLLEGSDAPVVVEARLHLEELLRNLLVASGDVGAMLRFTDVVRDDLGLVEAIVERLPVTDGRRPAVLAQRNRIARELSLT